MRRLGAACAQRRQMGFEGAEVAGSCGLEYGCAGGQADQLGIHKLEVDDLRLGFARQLVNVRGQSVSATKAREFFELMGDISFQHVVDIRDAETLFSDGMALGCGSYDGVYVRAALDTGQWRTACNPRGLVSRCLLESDPN